jgi:hypothetical protein
MEPIKKNTKNKAKKASDGGGRSSGRGENQVAALPVDILASWQDEEELIGYEPEVPPSFSPIQDDISVQEDRTPTQKEEQHYFPPDTDDLPASLAEDGPPMEGGKRSRIFSGASRTPSPLQDPDPADMNADYQPPDANKHVEMTREPEGARSKRRRGPDGAAVDGV